MSKAKFENVDVKNGDEIPILDISYASLIHVDIGNKKLAKLGEDLHKAFGEYGFAYLSGHGIPTQVVDDCMKESQAFFDLPLESKLSYSRGVQKIQGYSAFGREVLENDDIIEAKESFDVHCLDEHAVDSQELKDEANTFPDKEIPEFRPKVKYLATQAIRLAQRLLGALAKDLGVDPASFVRAHSRMLSNANATSIRLLNYPPLTGEEGEVRKSVTRCGVHTDYGGITLLFQDALGGLEIQKMDGTWISARPIPGTIVVNIGDLMHFWSGGRYRATPHRVRVTAEAAAHSARNSIAVFVHPNNETDISPLSERAEGASARPRTALEYVRRRFKETYERKPEKPS